MFSAEKVAKPLDFWGEMCYNGVSSKQASLAVAVTISTRKYYNVEDTLNL